MEDFIPISDVPLTFPPNSPSGTVLCTPITIVGDMTFEPSTFFNIVAVAINMADMVQGSGVITVEILDDDDTSKFVDFTMEPPPCKHKSSMEHIPRAVAVAQCAN